MCGRILIDRTGEGDSLKSTYNRLGSGPGDREASVPHFFFKSMKTIQAAAVLLKQEKQLQMGRKRLLKLLYVADRESLRVKGRPITGDHGASMEHGPVLSVTYNLIKGEGLPTRQAQWDAFLGKDGYRVVLTRDPGTGKLSRYELQLLQEVSDKYSTMTDDELSDLTHDFPEWSEPGKSSIPIPLEKLLEAIGRTDVDAVLEDARVDCAAGKAFGE